jgi:hypothetical protein
VAVFANLSFVESAGIAVLGAIAGVAIGLDVAMTLVLLAEKLLGWDEDPPVSLSVGCIYASTGFLDRAGS